MSRTEVAEREALFDHGAASCVERNYSSSEKLRETLTTPPLPRRTMLRMTQVTRIHVDKSPASRLHFIPEWAAHRGMRQADIVAAFPPDVAVDKSTVNRWFKGSMPKDKHLLVLAAIFETEPNSLFQHPDNDWLARFFSQRSEAERDQAIEVLKAMFRNLRTGTDG
jgi:succinate dehydrogenase flavin-adding protein (antitoxin of CptAB toxin-antitoxin module)